MTAMSATCVFFKHVLGINVTSGDNNEKRPHIRTIGKNSRNKKMPFVDGFLPSHQPYIFHWYLCVAFMANNLQFWRAENKKAQILITYQCLFMSPSLDSALQYFSIMGMLWHVFASGTSYVSISVWLLMFCWLIIFNVICFFQSRKYTLVSFDDFFLSIDKINVSFNSCWLNKIRSLSEELFTCIINWNGHHGF